MQKYVCDECLKNCVKLFHKKSKELPTDWYVCRKCFLEKDYDEKEKTSK